jgi:hypothetical protein
MDKIKKLTNPECYTPSSELFTKITNLHKNVFQTCIIM